MYSFLMFNILQNTLTWKLISKCHRITDSTQNMNCDVHIFTTNTGSLPVIKGSKGLPFS